MGAICDLDPGLGFDKIAQNFLFIGHGIEISLKLLFGGIFIGILFGGILSILRYSGMCRPVINGFISIIRGTPVMLQLSFVYFITPGIIGVKLGIISAGIIAFGINSSAYIAEILRSGIESLPKGQFEAAQTLEIPGFYIWRDIILPQVIANILPAMVNEVISLLKETALIATIGGMDIMRRSQAIAAEQYEYFMPLCIAALYYYSLVLIIEFVGRKIERRRALW
ncbi:MAG: amino acid ABC transporter permease [Puniceicoccales bacterium]|jgi:polar amino acid transport system permease protein|nr:amino acid ABC transporter permease [Puniceicoccales bacterium]